MGRGVCLDAFDERRAILVRVHVPHDVDPLLLRDVAVYPRADGVLESRLGERRVAAAHVRAEELDDGGGELLVHGAVPLIELVAQREAEHRHLADRVSPRLDAAQDGVGPVRDELLEPEALVEVRDEVLRHRLHRHRRREAALVRLGFRGVHRVDRLEQLPPAQFAAPAQILARANRGRRRPRRRRRRSSSSTTCSSSRHSTTSSSRGRRRRSSSRNSRALEARG
mmetsp:Transcript_799/g.2922  ORF Transcript_799/g.2922 Transcript_799/m.2922 type:complete len:225 (+) Transcript_799:756-1430(+)